MTILDGTVARRLDGGFVVAFDRLIGRPAEKVWAALTDPKILANWLGEVQVDLRVGGEFIIRFRQMSVVMTGTITALELNRLIEYSWHENYGMPGSVVRWEISAADPGCRLKLTHSFPPECVLNEIVGFAGGWHAFLDAIPTAVDGNFAPYADEKALDAGYRQRSLGDAARDEGAAF
jgi:uncharacterized protein YndB with AHSA1/START domain